jgi:hypothetical protein
MAFYKKSTEKVLSEYDGIVYILVLEIDGKTVYKIGITQRKIEERVVEILTSFWKSYRYFPKCYPKRFKKTTDIFSKEAQLHYHFANVRHEPEYVTDGCSEFFEIDDLEYLLDVYARCLGGEDVRELEQYNNEDDK